MSKNEMRAAIRELQAFAQVVREHLDNDDLYYHLQNQAKMKQLEDALS